MLVAFFLIVSLLTPLGVTAQDGDGDLAGSPDASADVVEQPPAPVETTSEPEESESLPEPQIIESESASEPEVTAEDPEILPGTEEMDTDSIETETSSIEDISTDSASAADGESPVVWVNTDAITLVDGITEFTLDPGASQTIALRYAVTTPRTSTTIHAALIEASDGWTLSTPNLVDDDPSPLAASWTERSTVNSETAFLLPLVLTAPATVSNTHTVSLRVWSTVTGTNGEEVGVAQSGSPILTATAVAPTPILAYSPSATPACTTVDDVPNEIAHGDFLDYICTYAVMLDGEHVSADAVQLDWSIQAAVEGGWSVQLLPPGENAQWTAGSSATAAFTSTSDLAIASNQPGRLQTSEQITFHLRVHRVACGTVVQPVSLAASVTALLPGFEAATIEQTAAGTGSVIIEPALIDIPTPTVEFTGPLDFGEIQLASDGPVFNTHTGTLQLVVNGLDEACGDWVITLAGTTMNGTDGSSMPANSLRLDSVNGQPLFDGACALDTTCTVATVRGGADASPTSTLNLGVSLVLPDQMSVATFNAKLTATMVEAAP